MEWLAQLLCTLDTRCSGWLSWLLFFVILPNCLDKIWCFVTLSVEKTLLQTRKQEPNASETIFALIYLMMEAEMVSETLGVCQQLTQLSLRET